jgi:hypothetical protein
MKLTIVVPIASMIFALPALFRGARTLARERAADTLDPLRAALGTRELLFQKWLGVVLGEWPLFVLMAVVSGVAVAWGVIPLTQYVLFFGGLLVVAGGLAAVGLVVSAWVDTPARATVAVTVLLVLAGGIVCLNLYDADESVVHRTLYRVIPPCAAWADIPVPESIRTPPYRPARGPAARWWVEGVGCWLAAGGLAGWLAWRQLRTDGRR